MNQASRRARVKQVFAQVLEQPAEQRLDYLAAACADDAELRAEVESLLKHHRTQTILPAPRGDRIAATRESAGGELRSRGWTSRDWSEFAWVLVGTQRRRLLALLGAFALLALLGVWTHHGIKNALRRLRGEQLQGMLLADVKAIELWIEERQQEARGLARTPELVAAVRDLVTAAPSGMTLAEPPTVTAPPRAIAQRLAEYLADPDSAAYTVVAPDRRILASDRPEFLGRLQPPRTDQGEPDGLQEVLRGRTIFAPPERAGARLVSAERPPDLGEPLVWTLTPVVAESGGEVLAVLALAKRAEGRFTEILNVGRMGSTGETYAFEATGRMISESRFEQQLMQQTVFRELYPGRSLLGFQVRDPGGDVTRGYRPRGTPPTWPLTTLAAAAVASRQEADRAGQQGLILHAYRDYRGVPVIGAWRWLNHYRFGVAAEVDEAEAYAPLRYLHITYLILFSLLSTLLGTTMWSAISLMRLRQEVGAARQLGQYTLQRLIGEGGMGQVYLARHALLKRPTAVKILRTELISPEAIARFEQEVQLASQLSHPNTIEIYDYGRTVEGILYYVMEYLEGLTLLQLVQEHGAVAQARAVHILRQICLSLREAHAKGLIHRDIKPSNVMLCARSEDFDVVKVLDFGLVKQTIGPHDSVASSTAAIRGTPLYMAPEQFLDPEHVDARTDIYAAGAVAYFLLVGRPVFDAATMLGLFAQVAHETPRRLSQVAPEAVSKDLEELVMSCLEKEPVRRPPTIEVVLALLNDVARICPWSQQQARQWWQEHFPGNNQPA